MFEISQHFINVRWQWERAMQAELLQRVHSVLMVRGPCFCLSHHSSRAPWWAPGHLHQYAQQTIGCGRKSIEYGIKQKQRIITLCSENMNWGNIWIWVGRILCNFKIKKTIRKFSDGNAPIKNKILPLTHYLHMIENSPCAAGAWQGILGRTNFLPCEYSYSLNHVIKTSYPSSSQLLLQTAQLEKVPFCCQFLLSVFGNG